MSTPRPLHILGIVRFYPDLREPNVNAWSEDQSNLAEVVLRLIDAGEAAVGYHLIVVPSPAMRPGRWSTMFNPATQTFAICEKLHEDGGIFSPDEAASMNVDAKKLGRKVLLERIRENHPEAIQGDTVPADLNCDHYAIGRTPD